MQRVQKIEFTEDKQILACLGPSLKQPKVATDYVNYEVSMIHFKAGENPRNIATLSIKDTITDASFVALMTMTENNYGVIAAFSDNLYILNLITVETVSYLEIVRTVNLAPASKFQ